MTIKILVLASNPSGTEPLKVNDEIRSIKESHERSPKREEFTILPEPAVRISDLQRIILREKPQIVHFCGHGTGHQGLVLENNAGQQQLVSTEALTELLKIFERRIECVVLNACHSQVQGKEINQHINFLIATKKEIRDDAALLFTKGFYDALFNGETYKNAYELGCNRIHLELHKSNNSERKLVPVYSKEESKYIDLPQHEILLFLEKKPPNIILKNDIPISNYTYQENVEDNSKTRNTLPCPYRGLFHFNPNDAQFFFGREVFVDELFNATQTKNFIPLLGASGSGKSSVILAGLVPRLEQEGNWKFAHFRPGDEPFQALAKALLPLYMPELNRIERSEMSRDLENKLVKGSFPLKDIFADIESNYPNQRVLLIADQFEEIYNLCPNEKIRQSFLDLLLDCFQSPSRSLQLPPVLVMTMRADFLGNALTYRPLADVLNSDIKLGAMNHEELSQVIEKPAAMLGVKFESGLVERILDDIEDEPGSLALLEFALTELWKEQIDNQLTHQAYENIGKVEGALAKYAEQKYQELEKKEQEQARQIFIQLVHLGKDNNDTRRQINRNEIREENWQLVTRKNGLADSRLVVTNRDNNEQETLEIVHEALIRHWKRLDQWLNECRDLLRQQRKIEDAAQEWQASGQKTDYLLSKKRLKEAKDFQKEQQDKDPLSELAVKFVAQSSKYQRKETIKSLGLFLIIPLIGTIVGGYFIVREIQLNSDKKLIRECEGKEFCHGRIEALERLVKAKRSLKSYNLSSANLESANLESANLESANLESANLRGANLRDANLREINLERSNLRGANLYHATFKYTANLKYANLKYANLNYANLNNATLNYASFNYAQIFNANLERANLKYANLHNVRFANTNLKYASFNYANLRYAQLIGANLRYANLIEAKNLTPSQIKLACYWGKAIYKGNWDEEKRRWIVDEKANKEYIEELKQDKASDPKEPVDCSRWE
ncbi:MAG: pentapeptide repeat-containing protein [Xenococcaceae cyanobacterium MO_234.B1]|nr:pentapeptide repeat-containing protein [Xenococcaceae cyanobacterium MO_234.B1]